jgi:hypothetical protein
MSVKHYVSMEVHVITRLYALHENAVFWDIRTQFVTHKRHYISATERNRLMLRTI